MCKPLRRARPWHPRLPHPLKGRGSPLVGNVRRAPGIADVTELSYITTWPEVDGRGRLRFAGSRPVSVDVDQAALATYLATARLRTRPLREGDAFAARTTIGRRAPGPRRPIRGWLKSPVFDVTADARDAAKAAYLTAAGRHRGAG
jgi:hypothetical protein